jgi:hypothetical protein
VNLDLSMNWRGSREASLDSGREAVQTALSVADGPTRRVSRLALLTSRIYFVGDHCHCKSAEIRVFSNGEVYPCASLKERQGRSQSRGGALGSRAPDRGLV